MNTTSPSSECLICGEVKTTLTVKPCNHGPICLPCVSRLEQNKCPYCRGQVEYALVSNGEIEKRWRMETIKFLSYRNNQLMKNNTKQIILVGPLDGKKEVLHKKFLEKFGIGEPFLWRCPFRPNAEIEGLMLNFKISSGEHPFDMSGWSTEIESLRPDYIFICLPPPTTTERKRAGRHWIEFQREFRSEEFPIDVVICHTSRTCSSGQGSEEQLQIYDVDNFERVVAITSNVQASDINELELCELSIEDLISCITENVNLYCDEEVEEL